ncbi:MAG: tetratricopeptide repeat protein [Thermodesulfobacteriota bacterium]
MSLSQFLLRPKTRQYLLFCVCLVLLAIALPFAYHTWQRGQVLLHQGQTALAAENYAQAATYLERAHRAGLDSVRLVHQLAQANIQIGRWDEAEEAYRALVHNNPDKLEFQLELAQVLFVRGHLQQAMQRVQSILAQRPKWSQALYLKGKIYTSAGDFEAAIAVYRKILGETT